MASDQRVHLGQWDPAPLSDLATLFNRSPAPWWIAGGVAIELAVGHHVRHHGDVDIAVLRRDQHTIQESLGGWECWAADPPGRLRPWAACEFLPFGIHDIWCRRGPNDKWRVQVMLEESHGQQWRSRRDARVSRPLEALGTTSEDGVPFLAPEVQLYYKAKAPQPKDEEDLAAVLPMLTLRQRRWLLHAISTTYGRHLWADRLRD